MPTANERLRALEARVVEVEAHLLQRAPPELPQSATTNASDARSSVSTDADGAREEVAR